MYNSRTLLKAIFAHPEDDALRLIYSDWLDEHGDSARADFIRLQLRLARLPIYDPRLSELIDQERAMLRSNEQNWFSELPSLSGVTWGAFERGFVESAEFDDVHSFLRQAEAVIDLIPLREARFLDLTPITLAHLASSRQLSRIKALDLSHHGLTDKEIGTLLRSPNVTGLEVLDLDYNEIGDEGLQILSESRFLNELRELKLSRNNYHGFGIQLLAESQNVENIVTLDVSKNMIGRLGTMALTKANGLNSLRELSLAATNLDSSGVESLLSSPYFSDLINVDISANPDIGDDGAISLAMSTRVKQIQILHLGVSNITDIGAEAIATSPYFTALRWLDLSGNRIGKRGAIALSRSPFLSELTQLDLRHNPFLDRSGACVLQRRFSGRLRL